MWLFRAWSDGRNVILADEMGLGKTLQSIGLVSELINRQKITRPFLIVVPLSTLENWRREFEQWCPEAQLLVLSGSKQSRLIAQKLDFYFDLKSNLGRKLCIPKFNVLLCAYDTLKLEIHNILRVEW